MKTFRVVLTYICRVSNEVDAETEQEALRIAKDEVDAGQLLINSSLDEEEVREVK